MKKKKSEIDKTTAKYQVYAALEYLPASKGIAKVFGILLLALILINALLIGVENKDVGPNLQVALFWFNVFSTFCFALEYFLRIWVADLKRPKLSKAKARTRYIFSLMGIIDLLSFLPVIFIFFVPITKSIIYAVRVIRVIRLVKITRYMRGLKVIGDVFKKRRHEIISAFAVVMLLCLASSILMYGAEHEVQPDKFDSIYTGMYWALTTMTSTGYGDLVPITAAGRFIGFLTMLLSIAVIAIPAGIFSAGFVAEFRERDARIKARRRAHKEAVKKAQQDKDPSKSS